MSEAIDRWLRINDVVPVSRETFERLQIYHDLLLRWSKIKNLVSPNTLEHIWERHFADSLQLEPMTRGSRIVVDLGSGAGFPGIVLALQRSEQNSVLFHLIESDKRKCAFLREVIRETRASAIVHCGRIEQVISTLPQPEVITARALASLKTLVKLSEPALLMGAIGVFPKGQDYKLELEAAEVNRAFSYDIVKSVTDPAAAIILVRSAMISRKSEVSHDG